MSFRDEYFDPQAIRRHAEEFDTQRFLRRFTQFVETKIASHPVLAHRAGLEYRGPGRTFAPGPFDYAIPDEPASRRAPTPHRPYGSPESEAE